MISSIFRMAMAVTPTFKPMVAQGTRFLFQAPKMPTTFRPLSQRTVDMQRRFMGNWPIFPDGSTKNHPERYESPNKDRLMQTNLELYRSQNFKHLRLERGSLTGSSKWLHDLLTHISESGSKTVEIVALANTFKFPKVIEWVEPSASKVQNEGACLKGMDQRPEILRMSKVRLTKEMIAALIEVMTSSSQDVVFEINTRN